MCVSAGERRVRFWRFIMEGHARRFRYLLWNGDDDSKKIKKGKKERKEKEKEQTQKEEKGGKRQGLGNRNKRNTF